MTSPTSNQYHTELYQLPYKMEARSLSPSNSVAETPAQSSSDDGSIDSVDASKMFFKWRNNEAYELQVVLNPKTRRKIQNRAAQRAFRQRKEEYIKDLEQKLAAMEEQHNGLVANNEALLDTLKQALNDNGVLLSQIQELLADGARPVHLSQSNTYRIGSIHQHNGQ